MPDIAYQTLGVVLALVGAALAWRALFHDRPRGRRRCPKCWYDLRASDSLTCSECGYTARRERQLFKTRRRWRWAVVSVLLILLGASMRVVIKGRRDGWPTVLPNTALIIMVPWFDSGWPIDELFTRQYIASGELGLYPWQADLLESSLRTAVMCTGRSCWTADDTAYALDLLEFGGQRDAYARILVTALDHWNPKVRAWSLGQMSSLYFDDIRALTKSDSQLLPKLIDLLDDPNPEVRREAVFALAVASDDSARIRTEITALVESEDMIVAAACCELLGWLKDESATNVLLKHVVRRTGASPEAIGALRDIRPPFGLVGPTLLDASSDESYPERGECLRLAIELGAPAQQVLPIAASMLDGYDPEAQAQSIIALCTVGDAAKPMQSRVVELLHDPRVARLVSRRLRSIRMTAAGISIPVLLQILRNPCRTDDDWTARDDAIVSIASFPELAPDVVPVLVEIWPECKAAWDAEVKANVANGPGKWSGNRGNSPRQSLAHAILRALGSFGASGTPALGMLRAEAAVATDEYLQANLLDAIHAIENDEPLRSEP